MTASTPFISITLVSVGLSFVIALIYRVLTKPAVVKKAKEDAKFYKAKISEAQKAGDRQKVNDYTAEMLKASQLQFRLGMKPMMVTMLLFIMILGWFNSNFNGMAFDLSASSNATFSYDGTGHGIYYEKVENVSGVTMKAGVDFNDDGMFSGDEIFSQGSVFFYRGAFWRVGPVMEGFVLFGTHPKENTVHFEMLIARMPFTLPVVGSYLSWFWWYFFISVPGTIIFRKLLGAE